MVDPARIAELQKYYQRAGGSPYIHLRGKADRLTSVVIPLSVGAVGAFLLARGYYRMITGTGKLE